MKTKFIVVFAIIASSLGCNSLDFLKDDNEKDSLKEATSSLGPSRFIIKETSNMWTFLLLDATTGRLWRCQYSLKKPTPEEEKDGMTYEYCSPIDLSDKSFNKTYEEIKNSTEKLAHLSKRLMEENLKLNQDNPTNELVKFTSINGIERYYKSSEELKKDFSNSKLNPSTKLVEVNNNYQEVKHESFDPDKFLSEKQK